MHGVDPRWRRSLGQSFSPETASHVVGRTQGGAPCGDGRGEDLSAELEKTHGLGLTPKSGGTGAAQGASGRRSPVGGGIPQPGPRAAEHPGGLAESDSGSIRRLRDVDGVPPEDSHDGEASAAASGGPEDQENDPEV